MKTTVKVKIKNDKKNLGLPKYQTPGSVGMDLMADNNYTICPGSTVIVGTGLSVAIPEGYEIQVRSRSGLAARNGIFVLNSPGTIDPDFRQSLKVILKNTSKDIFYVYEGDRIAQAVLCPVMHIEWEEVDELDETERKGGFGSTGV